MKYCVIAFDIDTCELKGVYSLKSFWYQFELIEKSDRNAFDAYHYVKVRSKQTRIGYKVCLENIQ